MLSRNTSWNYCQIDPWQKQRKEKRKSSKLKQTLKGTFNFYNPLRLGTDLVAIFSNVSSRIKLKKAAARAQDLRLGPVRTDSRCAKTKMISRCAISHSTTAV